MGISIMIVSSLVSCMDQPISGVKPSKTIDTTTITATDGSIGESVDVDVNTVCSVVGSGVLSMAGSNIGSTVGFSVNSRELRSSSAYI
jgi:hypothetical protein